MTWIFHKIRDATSEAVKTRFGHISEYFSQKNQAFSQNYEVFTSYLLKIVRNTSKVRFF